MSLENELGVVCWFSLMTTDIRQSNAFYQSLFDYDITQYNIPDVGTSDIYQINDCGFGGPVPLDSEHSIPSHWIAYFAVSDVDDTVEKVNALGGKVCAAPFDMPSIGRTAIISDPAGSVFHIFTPEDKSQTIDVMGDAAGQISWIELLVDDVESVRHFYSELLLWQIEPQKMGHDDELYYICSADGRQLAGIMKRPSEVPPMPPAWLPFFNVESIENKKAQAKALGAKELMDITAVPNVGRFCLLQDTTDGVLYLFEAE